VVVRNDAVDAYNGTVAGSLRLKEPSMPHIPPKEGW
jgi:hypothetical protein